jgi:sulfoxide reductase heme-binding subunit YedZ
VNDALWYSSRASGVVAAVLIALALVSGFLFSSRDTGRRRRPAWWLDLHNMLGGLALAFSVVHIVLAWLDPDLGVGLAEVLIPGFADVERWALAWGVIATYLLATAVFTSWPQRRFTRRTWRILHLGSVVAFALALVHALQLGTDAGSLWLRALLVLLVGVATFALGVRVFGLLLPEEDDSQPALR